MYPHERSLVNQLAEKPFAIVGVNSDADLEFAQNAVKENALTWRSFWNGPDGTSGPISQAWQIASWPSVYLLDGEGKIRFKNVRGKKLDEAIELLLKEAGQEVVIKHKSDIHIEN